MEACELTRGLYQGLQWVRVHSPDDAVMAVNNHWVAKGPARGADWLYYSAFAERRVFLEGWLYTGKSMQVGFWDVLANKKHPYPERYELCKRVFDEGNPDAFRTMVTQYGVTHVFVDRVHGKDLPATIRGVKLEFSNSDAQVFSVVAHPPK